MVGFAGRGLQSYFYWIHGCSQNADPSGLSPPEREAHPPHHYNKGITERDRLNNRELLARRYPKIQQASAFVGRTGNALNSVHFVVKRVQ